MKSYNITLARIAADHFIARYKEYVARYEEERRRIGYTGDDISGTKESAALRRASLDLTRALAEMRKA